MIPTLTTDRLILRAPVMEDAAPLAAYLQGPRSATVGGPFPAGEAFDRLCALLGHWNLRGYGRWIVADRDSNAALGIVGPYFPMDWPEPEIAWTVFDAAEGRGIAHEAALAARDYARAELGWHHPMSAISPSNTRSAALARRLGCTPEGDFTHPVYGRLDIWRHPEQEVRHGTS
ncbi:GNAT family N-acetyltransferase [Thetidibacter halocola]|uniref:GNAT family N-acetyltransferase n=1 Tax=Thetidibacter halocola TaxID=2827239 RepID=A0A8J7WI94_9RHOB|nr:GNAT family N-acetyltransferase [Thetidibacter halocola]MBS0125813.1 GNAT family N-acetyltransferase [Thetidibacter halocola]